MYNRIAGYKQYYKSLVMLGVPIIIGQLGAIITGLADTSWWDNTVRRN